MAPYWEIATPYDSDEIPKYYNLAELFTALSLFMTGIPVGKQIEAVVAYHRNDEDEEGVVVLDLDEMEVA